MLVILLLIGMAAQAVTPLPDIDAVIKHFYEIPFNFEGTVIPEKGDILWIKCDVTQDGHDDILVTGTNLRSGDWEWLVWDIYKGKSDGEFVQLMNGMTFDPKDVLVVRDEKGVSHLATIRPFSQEEQVVTALELDNERTISSVAFRDLSLDSEEDRAWLEKQRGDAGGLVQVIATEELARKYPVKAPSPVASQLNNTEEEPKEPVAVMDSGAASPETTVPAATVIPDTETVTQDRKHETESPVDAQTEAVSVREVETVPRSKARWIFVAFVVVAGLAANYYYRHRGGNRDGHL